MCTGVNTFLPPSFLAGCRVNTPLGTPKLDSADDANGRSVSPLPPLSESKGGAPGDTRPANGSLEAKIIDSIQIDLGDF